MNALAMKELTYEQWLEEAYGFTGTEDEVEEAILYRNRMMVDEIFEEDWCFSYHFAETRVIRLFQEEYIKDCIKLGYTRGTPRFYWE